MKRYPQPMFVIRMGRYNLWMMFLSSILIAACLASFLLDDPRIGIRRPILALAVLLCAQLPFYFMAYWWKRDRDSTNLIVNIVDFIKYLLSLVKHIFSIWMLVEFISARHKLSYTVIGLYPGVYQIVETAYIILAPIIIIIVLKFIFCCGRTKLKPG